MAVTSKDLIPPTEAAALLAVDPKTVSRWASAGHITSVLTPGGHRRFLRSEIMAIAASDEAAPTGWHPSIHPTPHADPTEPEGHRRDKGERERQAVVMANALALVAHAAAAQAAADVVEAATAVTAAAQTVAEAVRHAQETRTQAFADAAEVSGAEAAGTTAEVKHRADPSAHQLSAAASIVEALAASADQNGPDPDELAQALRLVSEVRATAMAAAQESVEAAARVASAVAAAATATAAFQVSVADDGIDGEHPPVQPRSGDHHRSGSADRRPR
jgi:excisionase family DNA binding protein